MSEPSPYSTVHVHEQDNEYYSKIKSLWTYTISTGYKISALVAHWHSDCCMSCSCLIPNYSTALVQEQQECNWQRWWLQVLWSSQPVLKGCLKVNIQYLNYLSQFESLLWLCWMLYCTVGALYKPLFVFCYDSCVNLLLYSWISA